MSRNEPRVFLSSWGSMVTLSSLGLMSPQQCPMTRVKGSVKAISAHLMVWFIGLVLVHPSPVALLIYDGFSVAALVAPSALVNLRSPTGLPLA